jgi:hypothetical protein
VTDSQVCANCLKLDVGSSFAFDLRSMIVAQRFIDEPNTWHLSDVVSASFLDDEGGDVAQDYLLTFIVCILREVDDFGESGLSWHDRNVAEGAVPAVVPTVPAATKTSQQFVRDLAKREQRLHAQLSSANARTAQLAREEFKANGLPVPPVIQGRRNARRSCR